MGSFADYLENEILDHILGGGDYTRPATVYVALSTTTPNDDGTNFTEPVGNNYARASVTNNATNWPAASSGAKSNGAAITFDTASGSWGTVTHFAIFDASSSGNMLMWGALTNSRAISSGMTPSFAIGELDVTLD